MDGSKLIHRLRLRNILSYGPDCDFVDLEPLNVLIGPNASGKSNLIQALSLLQAAPRDIQAPIRESGGIAEWLWKGAGEQPVASIEVAVGHPRRDAVGDLGHRLRLAWVPGGFWLSGEAIEDAGHAAGAPDAEPQRYYAGDFETNVFGNVSLWPVKTLTQDGIASRVEVTPDLVEAKFDYGQSVLSQVRDAVIYPEITYLAHRYAAIRLYTEWNLGRDSPVRRPQPPDMPNDFLEESARNLALVINDLQNRPDARRAIVQYLRRFDRHFEDITTRVHGGTVQLFLHEEGLAEAIPATRLSDGTLRYLCLLAVLCHPEPPPLICIEEPELGVHPDVLPIIAELLMEASRRTQLIITTHSDRLVSQFGDTPEAVVVCERGKGGTVLRRLQRDQLDEWLERYPLGELWSMGEIGGNPQ